MKIIDQYRFSSEDNIFTDLEFAFSFKKRVVGATLCLKIRRDSDDAETDLLLESSGEVDINSLVSAGGTLSTWIGSNDGYMVTDYDQKGNGYDMTQATTTRQARIVTAGAWNGFKDYTVGDCVYFSSGTYTLESGNVYVKADKLSSGALYYLSQAKPSSTNLISLTTSFGAPDKLRILQFVPGLRTEVGDTTMIAGINIIMYQAEGVVESTKMRLNSVNQSLGVTDGVWLGNSFFTAAGYTLQKGALIHNDSLYVDYKEYEMLGFNVAHSDAESLEIENTM